MFALYGCMCSLPEGDYAWAKKQGAQFKCPSIRNSPPTTRKAKIQFLESISELQKKMKAILLEENLIKRNDLIFVGTANPMQHLVYLS